MKTLEELIYYCKEENPFGAIMLTGKWGCGKTYLIDNDLVAELGDAFIVIRVSLFGKESLEEVKRDVQKLYFQKVILNLGSDVEHVVGKMPNISEEQAKNAREAVDELSLKTQKFTKSKTARIIKIVADICKQIPALEKIMSISPSNYIDVEPYIGDKKVVLVFDDLERCKVLDEIQVLGCINEYCENKHIKTIIVANEEVIVKKEKNNNDKSEIKNTNTDDGKNDTISSANDLTYNDIKEKIVTRTIRNVPDYSKIIIEILREYKSSNSDNEPSLYKEFLERQKEDIIRIFHCGSCDNIRSVKCAIQDFERIFDAISGKVSDEDLNGFFVMFMVFMLLFRDKKITNDEKYGYLLSDEIIREEYPEFYNRDYVLHSARKWIIDGEWEADSIDNEINDFLEKKKETEPKEIVKNRDLLTISDEEMIHGFPEVVHLAYEGKLSLDEYILFLENISYARYVDYDLPISVDMEKLRAGVAIALENLTNSAVLDTNDRRMICSNNMELLSEAEKNIYQMICDYRENHVQMFSYNKSKYIAALQSTDLTLLYECEDKRFNVFDERLANEVVNCFSQLDNSRKRLFVGIFDKTWEYHTDSNEFLVKDSKIGFEKLRELLQDKEKIEKQGQRGISAAIYGMFIKSVEKIISLLSTEKS